MTKRGMQIECLHAVIKLLANGEELDSRYKVHTLVGDFKGCTECHIKPDWLLIYYIDESSLTLTLINTGSHSDLFKK